ncbi:hypothetical protein MRX96_041463 [Rhipicephalus microplus]
MEEEDLKERQENEMKVLQSMFLDDVKDLRKNDKWKMWRPPELLITLRPQQSMTPFQAHVQGGSSRQQALEELRKELQQLTKQLVGEVMVLELAQHVQWFLRQHNTPERGSFYDEMLKNKEKKQEAEKAREQQQQLNQQRIEEEKQRQAFELEILRHREEMKVEARRRRTDSKASESKERTNCVHKPELLSFFSKSAEYTVQKGACLGHSDRGHSTFGGFDSTTGELVAGKLNQRYPEEPAAVAQTRQFMFIQMEFCEKSTLRTAIDNGLHREPSRMWRLFREVIEGLAHIHQQGMIHRDLKPVNIFLDSSDHVKIGDFGLATTALISRVETSEVPEHIDQLTTGSLTGRVGTTLYTAPELFVSTGGRVVYSQKVDIYSLGIILFEMSWPAPNTAMERVKLLANLRLPSISLPADACDFLSSQQVGLICWLLQHDPSQRPSAAELLASPQLPPPHLQEAQATEVLNHTVSNPQTRKAIGENEAAL